MIIFKKEVKAMDKKRMVRLAIIFLAALMLTGCVGYYGGYYDDYPYYGGYGPYYYGVAPGWGFHGGHGHFHNGGGFHGHGGGGGHHH